MPAKTRCDFAPAIWSRASQALDIIRRTRKYGPHLHRCPARRESISRARLIEIHHTTAKESHVWTVSHCPAMFGEVTQRCHRTIRASANSVSPRSIHGLHRRQDSPERMEKASRTASISACFQRWADAKPIALSQSHRASIVAYTTANRGAVTKS